MKSIVLLLCLLFVSPLIWAQDGQLNVTPKESLSPQKIVNFEFSKYQKKLQKKIGRVNWHLKELTLERRGLLKELATRSKQEYSGIEYFKRYIVLVQVKYADKNGEFTPKVAIKTRDQENINSLFKNFLNWEPLQGRISANHAIKWLERGYKELEDVADSHKDPSENNNSDLEILAMQEEAFNKRKLIMLSTAEKLQLKVNPNFVYQPKSHSDKTPITKTKDSPDRTVAQDQEL